MSSLAPLAALAGAGLAGGLVLLVAALGGLPPRNPPVARTGVARRAPDQLRLRVALAATAAPLPPAQSDTEEVTGLRPAALGPAPPATPRGQIASPARGGARCPGTAAPATSPTYSHRSPLCTRRDPPALPPAGLSPA
jgi:hypothetical protein